MAAINRQVRERFGANIDRLRKDKDISVDVLAERAELGRDEIDGILSGEIEADASTIYPLAGALGVDPGEFFASIEWIPGSCCGDGYRIEDPDG